MKYWNLSGNKENWKRALENNLWGVRKNLKKFWDEIGEADVVSFYVSSPVKGIIGFGRVESKFKGETPIWPDEIKKDKVIYLYRLKFGVEYVLPNEKWLKNQISIGDLKIGYFKGLQPVRRKEEFKKLLKKSEKSWEKNLLYLIPEIKEKREEELEKLSLHKKIKNKLGDIGKLEGYISEKEYPMNDQKLDTAWRKVSQGVPSHVFEVHVKGEIHRALSKLKHANDIWNSKLFLVTREKSINKVKKLLRGTFHEIKGKLRIVDIEELEKLYSLEKDSQKLKKEIGFIE